MDQTFSRWQPIALSLMRFITGLVLFQYGVAKLLKIPAVSPFAKVHLMSLFGAAGAIELTLGGLLLLGLFTRPVAFILAGEMAFALFHRTFPEELLPGCQWRLAGDRALLHLPVPGNRGRRTDQRRRVDRQEGLTILRVTPGSPE